MGFETPPMPSSKPAEKEVPKPRFVVGPKESGRAYTAEAFEKIKPLAEDMDEKRIDSLLGPIVGASLKENHASILDELSWREKDKRIGDEARIVFLAHDLEEAGERMQKFDQLRSKIALNRELNSDELSQLILHVKNVVKTLDDELYSINQDKEQDKYNRNREKAEQLLAAELFLVKKLKK